MRRPRLVVLAKGPGLAGVTEAHLDGADVVAINQAANHLPRMVDILSIQDPVSRIGPHIDPELFLDRSPEIWVNPSYLYPAKERWRALARIRRADNDAAGIVCGQKTVPPTLCVTLFTAAAHGYRDITIYGAEMRGQGSPTTDWEPFQEDSDDLRTERWARERRQYLRAKRHLRTHYGVCMRRAKTATSCVSEGIPL